MRIGGGGGGGGGSDRDRLDPVLGVRIGGGGGGGGGGGSDRDRLDPPVLGVPKMRANTFTNKAGCCRFTPRVDPVLTPC